MAHSTLNGHHISHMKVQPRMPLLKIVTKSTRKKSQGNYIMCICILSVPTSFALAFQSSVS